jgi:hypothetical protein
MTSFRTRNRGFQSQLQIHARRRDQQTYLRRAKLLGNFHHKANQSGSNKQTCL